MNILISVLWFSVLALPLSGCATREPFSKKEYVTLETTGYCKCQECCGWKRNLLLRPVYAYGPQKGEKKKIGVTASGKKATPGRTIAADTSIYPFGTKINIPGYGWGVVEDRGGAIKGGKIDLFFRTHKQALKWGRKTLRVEVVR
jgi:3D (Asp-Asp-Asp) domain-containing protein